MPGSSLPVHGDRRSTDSAKALHGLANNGLTPHHNVIYSEGSRTEGGIGRG
jgi:hypothetical protein